MTPRRRRFVHVFSTFGRGGPQVRATQLITHLGDGYEHVVQAMNGDDAARALLPHEHNVTFAPAPPKGGFFASRRHQAAWLREQRPDLVLTYNWGAIESVAAAKRARLPIVHHEDGFGPEELERRLWRRSLVRRWLLKTMPVVVPSRRLAGIAAHEWRCRNVEHLANGVDLQRFRPDGAGPEEFTIGSVGGLRPEKDYANLLHAVARLRRRVQVVLVGDGALADDLRALAGQLGIAERVTFAGQTDDTAPWYRRFSLFVLSSRTEQMPIAMLEAMATALPVVATDVGDVRGILPEAAGDCVVPAQDEAALAAAIDRVAEDAEAARRLGADNRRVVAERYESGICLERFCDVYRAAMKG